MDLNYKSLGEGQPLVILHGLFGTLDNWMSIARVFAEKYRVYLVDQRNHGLSPKSDTFNYKVMADDIKQFLEEHDIEKPVLLGHSMGGKTVMRYALDYPGDWKKLIVVDIAPRGYPVHHQQIIDGLKSLAIETYSSRSEADNDLAAYLPDIGQRQFLLKNLTRKSGGGFQWKMNLPVIEREIEKIGEPMTSDSPVDGEVLFIRGSKSHYISDEDIQEIPNLFPQAEVVTIDGAGHWVHAEKPEELVSVVTSFIDA